MLESVNCHYFDKGTDMFQKKYKSWLITIYLLSNQKSNRFIITEFSDHIRGQVSGHLFKVITNAFLPLGFLTIVYQVYLFDLTKQSKDKSYS